MDLRRIKTIFIFILIAINIMLAFVLVSEKNSRSEEKKIITQNLSGLLEKNMIYLPEALEIPDSPDISSFYLEKMFGSDADMAEKFLGSNYTTDGSGRFESETGVLSVDGNEFKFFRKNPSGSVSEFSEEAIEKLCRDEMSGFGMIPEVYEFSGFNFVEDGTRAIFTVKHDDAEFFDAYIFFDVSEKGVFALSGKNIISEMNVAESNTPYFSVVSVLTDLVKNVRLDKNISHTIVSIKPGYYIGRSEESYRNILAIPVWQIATDKGLILHYDARSGQEIQE
ncbi:MAG: hypothetical protein IJ285_04275 [Clostridia bacterium]|nr:hypothetical protein [Oscillospiraceae bacterium]MBQ7960415.1 hypothetical protein [Clostridia bacterium]